jgi:diguanylate cyclase (GGDEF)-like protein/PAS domain S-box-containing protein
MDAATNAILIADARSPDHPIVHVNRAFERMTGYAAAEVIGLNCSILEGNDRDQPELEQLRMALASGRECSVVLRNYRKDGTLFWNSVQVSPVRNAAGQVTHFVGIQSDVTELRTYQTQLEYRANHDALTGLLNRSALQDTLRRLVAHAKRAGERFVVLYLDLDRFKVVNDSLGHASGDQLLICVAERLTACVRESDLVARLGGDEFAVVLADTAQATSAASAAQKIIRAIEEPVTVLAQEVVTSTSIGACVFPEDGDDAESLLKNADIAMYRAKQNGRGRVCFYTEDLNRIANERLTLEGALRRGLARNEFELHYQPRVELRSSRITSVEALVRWREGGNELVYPSRFIPLAEETGLIVPLGSWVLAAACRQMRQWRDAGHDTLRVAVNLSARQLREPDFIETVSGILAECGLEPSHLELEITESVAMHDPEEMQRLLEKLNELGVSLAIDDFGTGQSSLAYLKRFRIDYLKIDQSFVQGIHSDPNDESIVRSIIGLGKNLKLVVIAEGVQTEEQRAFLETEGCDEMQGFLCSRPKPAHELVAEFA